MIQVAIRFLLAKVAISKVLVLNVIRKGKYTHFIGAGACVVYITAGYPSRETRIHEIRT
ncbi:MAG: hypothetical protein WCF03_15495 [Nitrososphaeraceae archaeon]